MSRKKSCFGNGQGVSLMKNTRLHLKFAVMTALLAGLATRPAEAQITTGTILGTVTDNSGAVLPGVVVKVVNLEQGLQRQLTTNGQGDYIFPELPLGSYRLTAQAKAFETIVREGIELHIQDKLRVSR